MVGASSFSNNVGDVGASHGGCDMWVLKLDAGGKLVWQKTFGGANTEFSNDISATADGSYILAGSASSSNTGDVGAGHGFYDYWVVKINASGTLVWQKTFGGSNTDVALSVASQADGAIVVAGYTGSNNTGDLGATHGDDDMWILKLDATGKLLWQKVLGGNSGDDANTIIAATDGGYVVGGYTSSNNNGDVGQNHGASDMWIVKLDANGKLVWQKTLGGANNEYANSLCAGPDGSIIVAGNSASNQDGDVGSSHGDADIWLVKLSSTGALISQMLKGGNGYEEAWGITSFPGEGYVVAGYTASNKSGDVGMNNGSNDAWLLKVKEF
jgi:hypothetical protein